MREKRPKQGQIVEGEKSSQVSAAPQTEIGKGKETAQPQVEAANITDVREQSSTVSSDKVSALELQQVRQLSGEQVRRNKLSVLQIALIAGIICSTALLTYSLFHPSLHYSQQQIKTETNTITEEHAEKTEKKSEKKTAS